MYILPARGIHKLSQVGIFFSAPFSFRTTSCQQDLFLLIITLKSKLSNNRRWERLRVRMLRVRMLRVRMLRILESGQHSHGTGGTLCWLQGESLVQHLPNRKRDRWIDHMNRTERVGPLIHQGVGPF